MTTEVLTLKVSRFLNDTQLTFPSNMDSTTDDQLCSLAWFMIQNVQRNEQIKTQCEFSTVYNAMLYALRLSGFFTQ